MPPIFEIWGGAKNDHYICLFTFKYETVKWLAIGLWLRAEVTGDQLFQFAKLQVQLCNLKKIAYFLMHCIFSSINEKIKVKKKYLLQRVVFGHTVSGVICTGLILKMLSICTLGSLVIKESYHQKKQN